MTETINKYCQSCGKATERYAKGGKCKPCQKLRTARTYAKKTGRVVIAKIVPALHKKVNRNYGGGRPSKVLRNKLITADIAEGMSLDYAANKYGISRQYILIVLRNDKRQKSGIDDSIKPFAGLYADSDHAMMAEMAGAGGAARKHTGA